MSRIRTWVLHVLPLVVTVAIVLAIGWILRGTLGRDNAIWRFLLQ